MGMDLKGEVMEQDTRNIHALEVRVPIAQDFLKFVTNVERYVGELPEYTNKKRIAFTNAVLKRLDEVKVPIGLKLYVTKFQNEIESARDAFQTGDIPFEDISFDSVKELKKITETLIDSLNTRITDLKENGVDLSYVRDETKAVEDTLQNANKEMQRLARIKNKPYLVCKAPVIPVPHNAYFIMENLKRWFRISAIGGYPILHDQLVVGVNRSVTKQSSTETTLREVIKKLETRKGVKYIKIAAHGASAAVAGRGIVWYWLMPEDSAELFRKCFRNYGAAGVVGTKTLGLQGIAIRDWGFADGS